MYMSMSDAQVQILRQAVLRTKKLMKGGVYKAVTVGYPIEAQVDAGAGGAFSSTDTAVFAPLVRQSLDDTWSIQNATRKHIVLSNLIKFKQVKSTQHEAAVILTYGQNDINPFVSEGKVPAVERSEIVRKTVKIKYMAVKREITQQAMAVNTIGGINPASPMMVRNDGPNGLALETAQGLRSLAFRYEENLFRGDANIYEPEFTGLRAQILAEGHAGIQVHDLRGQALTMERMVEDIARISEQRDVYASPDTILVPYRVWATLSNAAAPAGRVDWAGSSSKLFYNRGELALRTPSNDVITIKGAPLMDEDSEISDRAGVYPVTVTVPVSGVNTVVPTDATSDTATEGGSSYFSADDFGEYFYRAKAFYAKGSGNANDVGVVGPASVGGVDDVITLDFDDAAFTNADEVGDNPLIYYKIYRTDVDGDAGTEKFIARIAPNTDGASGGTLFIDRNQDLPGTGSSYTLQTDAECMYEARLLGTVRFPLAPLEMTQPFVLARFSGLFVKMPKRQMYYRNVALTL